MTVHAPQGFFPGDAIPSPLDPAWASHKLQLSKYCSNKAPYHRAHPSGTASDQVPHGKQHSQTTCCIRAPPWLQVEICSARCPWAAVCYTMGLSWATGASALYLKHLLPSFCTDLGGCRAASLMCPHSSPSGCHAAVFPFLTPALTEEQPASLLDHLWQQ